ncbi:MAG TPA: hypothetical protein VFT50_07810 [Baekduia sp.]|nr:hypothetical protein [Baekduia sp.]
MTLVHYDSEHRRLWIAGQRCHHGATGALLTCLAATTLVARQRSVLRLATLLAAGSALMVHDWHDRGVWFQPGAQDDA